MKENVLDVLMYLFENYFYDEPEDEPDRVSMEENLQQAGFNNGEIEKAFEWLDGLAEQRYQPEFKIRTEQPIRVFIDSETTASIPTAGISSCTCPTWVSSMRSGASWCLIVCWRWNAMRFHLKISSG